MTSLRGRLLIWLIGLLTAMGVLAGIAAFMLDRNEVDEALDAQLKQIALNVGMTDFPMAAREGDGVALDPEDEFVVTIWDAADRRHSSDPSFLAPRPLGAGYAEFTTAGETWRAYARLDRGRTIQVAQRTVVREEFAANSALRAVLPIAALVPLSWLLVGWIVGRVLAPLHAVTDELRQWGKARTKPLALADVPAEILPLALATNDLVTRLQAQIEFRQNFISDAAHELRTPLTALRLQAGNLSGSAASSEQAALIKDMEEGVRRMSSMVGQLLKLARADAAAAIRSPAPVDLDRAIAASVQDVLPLATAKAIDIGMTTPFAQAVLADPDDLRTLIGNLVDNAVRYTPRGGCVDLAVERAGHEIIFEVRDSGPGIPEPLLDRVFERFVRVAGSDVEGSGLGLPIVKAIAERCGARVALVNRQDCAGLVARVRFSSASP